MRIWQAWKRHLVCLITRGSDLFNQNSLAPTVKLFLGLRLAYWVARNSSIRVMEILGEFSNAEVIQCCVSIASKHVFQQTPVLGSTAWSTTRQCFPSSSTHVKAVWIMPWLQQLSTFITLKRSSIPSSTPLAWRLGIVSSSPPSIQLLLGLLRVLQ